MWGVPMAMMITNPVNSTMVRMMDTHTACLIPTKATTVAATNAMTAAAVGVMSTNEFR